MQVFFFANVEVVFLTFKHKTAVAIQDRTPDPSLQDQRPAKQRIAHSYIKVGQLIDILIIDYKWDCNFRISIHQEF